MGNCIKLIIRKTKGINMELKYKNNVIEFDIKKNGNEFTLDYNNQKTLDRKSVV